MAGSLKDQLLKAGVASRKQAKEAELEKRRKQKQGRQRADKEERERAAAIEAARVAKLEKDRQLNEQRKQEQAQRALQAEIRQLAEQHRIDPPENADLRYHFVWENRVRSLWVDAGLRAQLSDGRLALVAVDQAFLLVPAAIAHRIRLRDPNAVVQPESGATDGAPGDDEYADYPVPDDLHW
ncbi:putative nucleoprotein/polynucleotide-associated enzyme [Thioalkalivibrio nitratireducens DSM 14787]|uniref:Nucleoprotein/polynucleotide-associated enzyme n=1 Tax=Thioalkalivibrio nitratireducens (strain DSM 14787 / UNIQEM 213 / ALEN2) TaxID=1255043 RepID=L0DV89_THIND|nr:DUF2058 domain-containing protein [Thioalkalivibrio nitratireducens]AGA32281.1 putative nucleoprotein/polynucleotide-associated enzyme [Thioalkalivibrio nitratireducens DSM 14787]